MSKKILVAYASVSGSTGEVAEAIGEVLGREGATVDIHHVQNVTGIGGYGAAVVGSSIRAGKWLPEAMQFVENHEEALSQMPVAYFTTCLTMVDGSENSRRTVLAYMEPVRQKASQIKPVGLGLFAGALDPTRQLMMQTRAAPHGDYRDWEAIRAWAEEIRPALLEGVDEFAGPVILQGAVLSYTDMAGANLHEVDLSEAELREANLQGANLSQTDLSSADLSKADLDEANLHEAGLNWADLNWANMSGADLSGANLIGADMKQANLSQANLSRAILNGATLSQADLSGANLNCADLNWADLSGATLSQANLREANLGWANLSGANLNQADLAGAKYNNQTVWPEAFSAEAAGCLFFRLE